MRRNKRNELRDNIKRGFVQRYTVGEIDALLDYVDTLEEIVECVARNKNTALGHQAREALDKGK